MPKFGVEGDGAFLFPRPGDALAESERACAGGLRDAPGITFRADADFGCKLEAELCRDAPAVALLPFTFPAFSPAFSIPFVFAGGGTTVRWTVTLRISGLGGPLPLPNILEPGL